MPRFSVLVLVVGLAVFMVGGAQAQNSPWTFYGGLGYGKALFRKLAQLAGERGCGRLEWWCLNWNTPSIGFYLSMGAKPMP